MNYKKTTILIIFTLALFVGAFGASTTVAYAENLVVNFEADPLFSEANFLPGNEVVRTVGVTNNSEESQDIIVESINATDEDGLGDELNLVIKEGATTLYDDTLGEFLRAGEVSLSELGVDNSTTYSFGVTFNSGSDNDTQATNLGFDLCVGFEGGETNCGGTTVGGEGGTDGGGTSGGGGSSGGSGGGGGGGGGIIDHTPLEVFNEEVTDTNNTSVTAVIEWDSNLLSTSQVVYGKESDGPYSLNMTVDPYFGYPQGTLEDKAKVTHHVVVLTGLDVGETYLYRVVSRASPPTVGFEQKFTLAQEGNYTGATPTSYGGVPEQVGGDSPDNTPSTYESLIENILGEQKEALGEATDDSIDTTQVAALGFLTIPDNLYDFLKCLSLFLLFLLLIYIAWVLWGKEKYKEADGAFSKRLGMFFFVGALVSLVVAYLLDFNCTMIPLSILAVISLALYLYRMFTDKEETIK